MAEALNVKWEAQKDDNAFQRNSITESLVRINSTKLLFREKALRNFGYNISFIV